MNASIQHPEPKGIVQPSGDPSRNQATFSSLRNSTGRFVFAAVLAGLLLLLLSAPSARAQGVPPGCTGSAIGISLFTSAPDVHIGDTLFYSVSVFNGLVGNPTSCDASNVVASITTPDGIVHPIALRRTYLTHTQSDFYTNVVSYVVRSQDIRPDGTLRATAEDTAVIYQNDTPSTGGANQGVNTEVSLPCVALLVQCVGGVGENGAINFTGTVTNCGNNMLVGVTVTNFVNGGQFQVTFITNLLRGQIASFSGSWVPLNPCSPSTASFVAQGIDQFTSNPRTVTSSADTTCQNTLTPGIKVTKSCPIQPVSPGQLLTFSGTVSNTGTVTLTNIVVVNNQPSANTVVFTRATLAPGEVVSFDGSYPAPADCSASDTLTATAASRCGTGVSDTVSATCPIATAPQIAVTAACPTTPVLPGGPATFSGTVRNTGNITLRDVSVVSDRTVGNVFTVATLAPGATANFNGTYTVPDTGCAVVTSFSVSGRDICTLATVTNTTSTTCPIITAPAIAVTLACPPGTANSGGLIIYSGTVRNSGNVTLNNVTVVNNQSSPSTVFAVASLAPGASANFTASFTAPADGCAVSSTVTATGSDTCTLALVSNSASATCSLNTTPRIVVTQLCPVNPTIPGGLLTYSGTVSNAGNIMLTNVVVLNNLSGATPVFTAATLAPGAIANYTGSYTAPTNCSVTSTSTATGRSICGVAVSDAASATCLILTAPQIAVTVVCPTTPVVPGSVLNYSGTVRNTGNITLTNVVVLSDRPSANTSVFTVGTLAPGASAPYTASFTVPAADCSAVITVAASGKDTCTGATTANTAVANCSAATAPSIVVTLACPVVPATVGGVITYTGTVRNSGNVGLNNVTVVNSQSSPNTVFTVASLAPGATANFTASFTAPADTCQVSSTVTASGADNCTTAVVTDSKSATCTLTTAPAIAITQNCPVEPLTPGSLVTFNGTVLNAGNITLSNVVVTRGGSVVTPPSNTTNTALWVDDDVPAGAQRSDARDSWNWVSSNPAPFSGTRAHRSESKAGLHSHLFTGATTTLAINVGDTLITYVYLDPANVPSEVMLEWNDGSTEHRAYWGANLIILGTDGTASRRFMGPLPAVGKWVRLEVPASSVGLEGRTLTGMAFTLYDGRATWDAAGKATQGGTTPPPTPSGEQVFAVATLAPGASANFTVSYTLPADSGCSFTSTLTATGANPCTGARVTANATSTCPLLTSPQIVVTQICPPNLVRPGDLLTYSGTVRNAGNITLTNVVVVNNQPADHTVIYTVATLSPGETKNFTGSYRVPLNCCVSSSTVGATGSDICTGAIVADTYTATCIALTAPRIVVTKACPPTAVRPGELLEYSGTVSNAGDITLVEVTIVNSQPSASSPIFGPITLAPGESVKYYSSYIALPDFCGTDTVTARGLDACTFAPVVNSATTTCPVNTDPRILVTKNCPVEPTPHLGLLVFTGTVSNPGNVTLTNVFVVNNQPDPNTPVIGPITLAPGASVNFTGSYTTPEYCCSVVDTLTAHGQDRCSGEQVAATATAICPLLNTPLITVTKDCPTTPVPVGGLLVFSGSVSNAGDTILTNVYVVSSQPSPNTPLLGPIELAPREVKTFSGSYTVTADSNPQTDTVTARGMNTCKGITTTAMANCLGPVTAPAITTVNVARGVATVTWTATPGVTYRLQCGPNSQNSIWIDCPGDVTATGATASKTDALGSAQQRFYRVMVVQ